MIDILTACMARAKTIAALNENVFFGYVESQTEYPYCQITQGVTDEPLYTSGNNTANDNVNIDFAVIGKGALEILEIQKSLSKSLTETPLELDSDTIGGFYISTPNLRQMEKRDEQGSILYYCILTVNFYISRNLI